MNKKYILDLAKLRLQRWNIGKANTGIGTALVQVADWVIPCII